MRILVADDDTAVIQSLLAILKTQPGHELRVATSGGKALENAAALGGVDLLLTDVVMQPMDGFALRDQLTARYPEVRTIFITGYDLSEYAEQLGSNQVLAKPIEREALLAAIEREWAAPAAHVSAPPIDAPVHALLKAPTTAAAAPEPPTASWSETFAASSGESLIGQTIGAYQILSHLGESRWGTVYAAVQVAINRPVGLKILAQDKQGDAAAKARFIADARAKAHVQHPSILSVYEAGEAQGRIFYAQEYVDGQNLAEVQASGRKVDEPTALRVLRSVGEGLAYLHTRNVPHTPLKASDIYLGVDAHPRMANLASQHADQPFTTEQEIQTLGRAVLSIAPAAQQLTPGLRMLLSRMVQTGPQAISSWGALLQGVKALEPKIVPIEAAKISAQDRAAIEAVEAARRAQKRSLLLTVVSLALTLLAVLGAVYWKFIATNERRLEGQVEIPAGTYLVGEGDRVTLEAFSIDKYEVTFGQYAKFLEYLAAHPTAEEEFNHPKQPKNIFHEPPDWAIYYGRARTGKPVHGVPTDLNSPMIVVTWWSAYAYAKWKGRDLPTEQQWEAAGRGPKGLIYPWGDEFDPKKVNSNADYNANDPAAIGTVDGFNFWNAVDKVRGDKSPFGVIGMAGNVSEWTATWAPDGRFPVLKGGNFTSADVRLDKRVLDQNPGEGQEHIGFRTVSNTPSPK